MVDYANHAKHIRQTAEVLKTSGLNESHRRALKKRLPLVWGPPLAKAPPSENDPTKWYRDANATNYYQAFEDVNSYFFLVVVLAVPPTSCPSREKRGAINKLVEDLIKTYRVDVGSERLFFEELENEAWLFAKSRYRKFMRTMFPLRTFYKTNFVLY
jgi:hypothetical protein